MKAIAYRRPDGLVVTVGRIDHDIERAEADRVITLLNKNPPPTGWMKQEEVKCDRR